MDGGNYKNQKSRYHNLRHKLKFSLKQCVVKDEFDRKPGFTAKNVLWKMIPFLGSSYVKIPISKQLEPCLRHY